MCVAVAAAEVVTSTEQSGQADQPAHHRRGRAERAREERRGAEGGGAGGEGCPCLLQLCEGVHSGEGGLDRAELDQQPVVRRRAGGEGQQRLDTVHLRNGGVDMCVNGVRVRVKIMGLIIS
jgi:hypothetical protein